MTRRMALPLLFLALQVSVFAAPASSPEENYRRAMSLLVGNSLNLTDRSEVLSLLQLAAERNFAPAQTALGTAYERGTLGTQDIHQAIEWFTRAGGQGDWIAQLSLGVIFFKGVSVPRDTSAAKKWLTLAAASGDGAAAFYLGRLQDEGGGAITNYPEAINWYRLAALAGNPFAQERLASMLLKGLGGSRKPAEAYMWLLVAVELGNHRALQSLQSMEGDLGKAGADAVRRQALELRDRILGNIPRECSGWDGQYSDSPTPPPLRSQSLCEKVKQESAAN
jgi:TPR repeat protein